MGVMFVTDCQVNIGEKILKQSGLVSAWEHRLQQLLYNECPGGIGFRCDFGNNVFKTSSNMGKMIFSCLIIYLCMGQFHHLISKKHMVLLVVCFFAAPSF